MSRVDSLHIFSESRKHCRKIIWHINIVDLGKKKKKSTSLRICLKLWKKAKRGKSPCGIAEFSICEVLRLGIKRTVVCLFSPAVLSCYVSGKFAVHHI